MKRNPSLLRLVVLAMLVAVGVVISPILRVEGMCPTAHLINIVCAVLLGPVYSFVCACTIGVIRMSLMGIPPLAPHRSGVWRGPVGHFVPSQRRAAHLRRHR